MQTLLSLTLEKKSPVGITTLAISIAQSMWGFIIHGNLYAFYFFKKVRGGYLSQCLVFECHKAYKMPNELPNGM